MQTLIKSNTQVWKGKRQRGNSTSLRQAVENRGSLKCAWRWQLGHSFNHSSHLISWKNTSSLLLFFTEFDIKNSNIIEDNRSSHFVLIKTVMHYACEFGFITHGHKMIMQEKTTDKDEEKESITANKKNKRTFHKELLSFPFFHNHL